MKWAIFLVLVVSATVGSSQSFNADLDIIGGSELVGHGVPSPSFAAMGLAGVWNRVSATGGTQTLLNLDGTLSSVVLTGPQNGGSGHGYNNPNLSGDFRLLMADGREVGDDTWTFSNLATGSYQLITYAVAPVPGFFTSTLVTVPDAHIPQQIVTGPIPANQFALGITHSRHEISVTTGSFSVRVQQGARIAYVNGFQLVSVPEPSTIVFLSACLLGFVRKRRNS